MRTTVLRVGRRRRCAPFAPKKLSEIVRPVTARVPELAGGGDIEKKTVIALAGGEAMARMLPAAEKRSARSMRRRSLHLRFYGLGVHRG